MSRRISDLLHRVCQKYLWVRFLTLKMVQIMKQTLMTFSALLLFTSVHAQLLNSDYETWTGTAPGYWPAQWGLYSNDLPHTGPSDSWRSADAHSGSYALQLSVWYFYTDTKAVQKVPVTYRPAALTGWYKYTENTIKNQTTNQTTDDTANATVYLTKWNTSSFSADTIGYGKIELLGSTTYKQFTCAITYTSPFTPDTVIVSLDPSLMKNGAHTYFSDPGYSSFLKIDDLMLQSSATNIDHLSTEEIKLWPNPAAGFVEVFLPWASTCNASVIDVSGRVVKKVALSGGHNHIQLTDLITGTYILKITSPYNGKTYQHMILQN